MKFKQSLKKINSEYLQSPQCENDFHRGACAPSSCSLCSLSSTLQRTQPTVLISLGLAESRILSAAPVDTRPGHLSSHSALSSYGLLAPLTLWRLSVSQGPLVQALGSCPASGASLSSVMPPSLRKGWVNNNNNNNNNRIVW